MVDNIGMELKQKQRLQSLQTDNFNPMVEATRHQNSFLAEDEGLEAADAGFFGVGILCHILVDHCVLILLVRCNEVDCLEHGGVVT